MPRQEVLGEGIGRREAASKSCFTRQEATRAAVADASALPVRNAADSPTSAEAARIASSRVLRLAVVVSCPAKTAEYEA